MTAASLLLPTCFGQQYIITTYAGGAATPTSAPAAAVAIQYPYKIAADTSGNVYFSNRDANCVFKIDKAGVLTRVAGKSAAQGFAGDGGLATSAMLSAPQGLATDDAGNLYIADTGNHAIRRVAPNGVITTIAGTGWPHFGGDGGPAILAGLAVPAAVAVDGAGNLFIADAANQRVRKISVNGIITTVAGNGGSGYSGDGGPATLAQLGSPNGVAVDGAGNLWISNSGNNRVRKVAPTGIITTAAGTGLSGFAGDGGPATLAQFQNPTDVAVDAAGNLFIVDEYNYRIRKVASDGTITTVAGNGVNGYSGDGGPAIMARLFSPTGIASDGAGNIYIADSNNQRIRKVTAAGVIVTIAGNGARAFTGDGGPAANAQLNGTSGLAFDGVGNLFIADSLNNRIRKVAANGVITTVAGNGSPGFSGDGGPAVNAQLWVPSSVFVDASNNLYIADYGNHRVRKVAADGTIGTVAGNGFSNYFGDGGPATSAQLDPRDMAMDAAGNLFIADTANSRIRKVAPTGTITTVAGTGAHAWSGDGGQATIASLNFPVAVAVDQAGRLYTSDLGNGRIRMVDSSGVITTVAGDGTASNALNDGSPAVSVSLPATSGLAVDGAGVIYLTDGYHGRVRKVVNGIISTVAGTGTGGYTGDGGLAIFAQMGGVWKLARDSAGNLCVSHSAGIVRLLVPQNNGPVLGVRLDHATNFTAGQGGSYSVVVSNAWRATGSVLPTSGTVTVTEILPAGLTLAGMSGTGWTCSSGSCTRSDPLQGGASYPPITVTVGVNSSAAPQVINQVSVSGGGSFSTADSDATTIIPPPCAYTLSPSGVSIAADAYFGSFNVSTASGCAWTATSNAAWITITAGSAGSGNGVVSYSIALNIGVARTGTITAAGQPFTIFQAGAPSRPSAVEPAAGVGANSPVTFTFTDSRGWQNLGVLNILINDFLDGRHACYLAYIPGANLLLLVNDAGDAGGPFAGQLTIDGSANAIENSQCRIDGAGSARSGIGNTLTLTLNMTFKAAWVGNRIIYMAARDQAETSSGWKAKGTWQISGGPRLPIQISSLGSTSGPSQSYNISIVDLQGTADIGVINLLVNDFIDGRHACYLAYIAPSKMLVLVNDAGAAGGPFAGSLVLGDTGTIQNSQCTVSLVSVNDFGALSLRLNVNYRSGFTGNKVLYVAARDTLDGKNTGWQAVGTWGGQ